MGGGKRQKQDLKSAVELFVKVSLYRGVELEGMGGPNVTVVRRDKIPLPWRTAGVRKKSDGQSFDRKFSFKRYKGHTSAKHIIRGHT